jgi:predicted DNA-binding protein (UPF0251 family)
MSLIKTKAQAVLDMMDRLGFVEDSETDENSFPRGAERGGPLCKTVDELQKAFAFGHLPARGAILWKALKHYYCERSPDVYEKADAFREWLETLKESDALADRKKPRAPSRRRRVSPRKAVPLTGKQSEAMHLVGEHKGNITRAAKAAGKSRQAMKKLYEAACKKLGRAAHPSPKTRRLETDARGQETDGRGQESDRHRRPMHGRHAGD